MNDTAVYGLGTMVPRLLNYAVLTPYYTRKFMQAEYGIITELYAYVVVLQIILTYGMETGYFRFSNEKAKEEGVYPTILFSLLFSSTLFILLVNIFSVNIARFLEYSDHKEYIIWFAWIVAIDAFTCIPFAKLRKERKAMKFSLIKIANVAITIFLVFFFYELMPHWVNKEVANNVRYVFIANLVASIITLLLLMKEILIIKFKFDIELFKKILIYSLPLLIAGLAGSINEALDRILLKHLLPASANPMAQLGIYGANYKIAVFISLFIQMFRYAADPFFFANMYNKDAKELYARVMNYFVIFCSLIFLGLMMNIDIFKFFIGRRFHEGLSIVPIILLANLLLGVYFNLSIWYKLNNKTIYGAVFMLIGATITIISNILLVPVFGYKGAAWTHLIVYTVMVILSYYYGQRKYTIPYQTGKLILYIGIPVLCVIGLRYVHFDSVFIKLLIGNIIVLVYLIYVIKKERVMEDIKIHSTKIW